MDFATLGGGGDGGGGMSSARSNTAIDFGSDTRGTSTGVVVAAIAGVVVVAIAFFLITRK